MKIVHICLCGPMTDGWNYQENMLTAEHKKLGLDVTIVASQWIWGTDGEKVISDQSGYINEDGVKVIRLPLCLGTVDTRLKVYKGLMMTLVQEAPDIMFIHDVQYLDVLTIVQYLKNRYREGRPVRTYADNHVDYSNGARNWLSKSILHKVVWRSIVNRLEPWTEKFYGVLPARVDFLKEMYHLPEKKCELLVMGAEDTLVEKAKKPDSIQRIRETYGITAEDFLVVTGGKIDEYKIQTLFLMEAIRNITDEHVKLLVFGSVADNLKERVQELCDRKKVQYIGWIQAKESYRYFAAANLVVFPGRHSVFWEQVVAQGIPMLCKEWEGTKHIDIGGNVEFLKDSSVDEITRCIEGLLANPDEFENMKAASMSEERKRFLYNQIAREAIDWRDE